MPKLVSTCLVVNQKMGPGILGLESEKTSFSKINTSEGFFLKDDDDDDDGKA